MKSSKLNSSAAPLIAEKELFRLWYEFYRLALTSNDKAVKAALKKSAKFYESWGKDPSIKFDHWWKTHRALFIDADRVQALEAGSKAGGVLVWVPNGKSETLLVEEFQALLRAEPERFKVSKRKKMVSHPFAPTEVQGVKREALRMMLALQQRIFSQQKLKGHDLLERVLTFFNDERYQRKANKIPTAFFVEKSTPKSDHHDEAMRNVRRYRQKAANLVLNVAGGVFPGRY
jgi:hypothetical protein